MQGVQVKLCLNCSKPIVVSGNSRKVFCSKRCRQAFHSRAYFQRKKAKDPEWAKRSLEALMRWKEQHLMMRQN